MFRRSGRRRRFLPLGAEVPPPCRRLTARARAGADLPTIKYLFNILALVQLTERALETQHSL
jgi:hypothetical protein